MKKEERRPLTYEENFDHIRDELKHLDLLISHQAMRFRLRNPAQEDASCGQMFISHERIDRLLAEESSTAPDSPGMRALRKRIAAHREEIAGKISARLANGIHLAIPCLKDMFQLSPLEAQILIICLAPELDQKYDTLYAYLQDDYTRRKPGMALVLDLLCLSPDERWMVRPLLSRGSPLFRSGILQAAPDHSHSESGALAQPIEVDPRIVDFILGNNTVDARIDGFGRLFIPSCPMDQVRVDQQTKERLRNLVYRHINRQVQHEKTILHLHGPRGAGKRDLALAICTELRCPLLILDLELLPADAAERDTALRLAFREGLLSRAIVSLENVTCLQQAGDADDAVFKKISRAVAEFGWLVFMSGEKPWSRPGYFADIEFISLQVSEAEVPLREQVWRSMMGDQAEDVRENWSARLARSFMLTPGQIEGAARQARINHAMNGGEKSPSLVDYYAGCRSRSNHGLEELACRIAAVYGWDDLVLPGDKMSLLKEICSQVKHQYQVLTEWGFARKLSSGKGQSVLFSGPPGTGKTMAAQVIASALQLDLYRIDLSGVVSKYIGETEKNLCRIFREAERSNAILFFDEADALFGKRTEISDAHDRYANIETSYLLQKMEEHEGMVILATNLRANMDEAFTRRLRFIIEFPFPDESLRRHIWKNHFPAETPAGEEIDYEYLARRFVLSGANIRNIVLNAAFQAAAENKEGITMKHIFHGLKREYEKIGRLWDERKILMERKQEGQP
ncbi:MAG: ATP-binding protein [Proteobacteria bacterium]|nr:ATP-binding protein [Pseudomonadota bacterium]MBU4297617.1 ATP-binding protein [Pseudomonadota bacterium]MCG2750020.1 ATP-binding protein [Desulfobulbaceae bacterium]